MTGAGAGDARETREDDGTVSPWRGTTPELLIAAAGVLAVAVAGYAMAGWAGLSVVAVATAAIAMVVLRVLLPQATPDQARKAREKAQARMLSGYSHRRFVVRTSSMSLAFYQGELRPVLEHLLAARLAERHGVNLYQESEAARRLLCRSSRDADLWPWIAPAPLAPLAPLDPLASLDPLDPETTRPKASGRDGEQRGIPRRTLARLIDRLEKL